MTILPNFNYLIKDRAAKHGFALCGVVETAPVTPCDTIFLNQWLEQGRNADMEWFNRNKELRSNPSLLLDNAQTMVIMAFPYAPIIPNKEIPNIASYAHATDYHYVLKEKLNHIIEEIKSIYGQQIEARAFTDSAPIMERYWAVKAGFGWIGKSGMLINRKFGSYLLLCEIIINRKSDLYDTELPFNGCGECSECLEQCPTGAISKDKSIDARKCISYLTIEHRGDFTEEQKTILHNTKGDYKWLYGCDTCLGCCPWNKKLTASEAKITFTEATIDFKKQYGKTPLARTGQKALLRNLQELKGL